MRTGTIVAVGLLLVLVSIAGVGLLVGAGSGDQEQSIDAAPTATESLTPTPEPEATSDASDTATPTPEPEATSDAPDTATPTPPQTPEDDQTDSVSVNQSQLAAAIEAELNEGRSFNSRLDTDSTTSTRLANMAGNHSQDMASQQFLSHNVGNGNSQDRYERNGLFGRCEFQKESYILDASDNDLEVIGRVSVDAFASGGSGTLEERLAEALVADWESTPRYDERISYENAERMGVGVAVSSDNEVYATVNFC